MRTSRRTDRSRRSPRSAASEAVHPDNDSEAVDDRPEAVHAGHRVDGRETQGPEDGDADHLRDCVVLKLRVVVEQHEQFTRSSRDSAVARRGKSGISVCGDDDRAWCDTPYHLQRAVGRATIHDDQLDLGVLLRQQ